jgi:acyl-CoA synthetase (AMP-forming)/AMP-acid ligase II
VNIAATLRRTADACPHRAAVVAPSGYDRNGRRRTVQVTFRQLDAESDAFADTLVRRGVKPGHRIVLMVRPGIEFISCAYAIFKTGATVVLIDPGMGRGNLIDCLERVDPDGFVATPLAQAIRLWYRRRFPRARLNVSVGDAGFWTGGWSDQDAIRKRQTRVATPHLARGIPHTPDTDPAAIIFTSGSTGPPKGVVYEHGMFAAQAEAIRDFYGIQPGEVDMPGFPLFALFNAAMGVTTVIPDMDATRPAATDPIQWLDMAETHGVTQSFGSPAIWRNVAAWTERYVLGISTIRRVLMAGAPVPPDTLVAIHKRLPIGGDCHTPYGATEALPVSSIAASEVAAETAAATLAGAGTCVGKPFPNIRVQIIAARDEPIATLADAISLPQGEVGEIIVSGPVVTREYFQNPAGTAAAKIADGDRFWHRMGDVGYFDAKGRLWFCGRKAHVVHAPQGPMYTDRVEPIFNQHRWVRRTALVGVGPRGDQRPVVVVELLPVQDGRMIDGGWTVEDRPPTDQILNELRRLGAAHATTAGISTFLLHPSLPVDVRHNAKINREPLAAWAASQIRD